MLWEITLPVQLINLTAKLAYLHSQFVSHDLRSQ
uniref:Uncharacterized protein n=1 Tax=Anguilla anguilla TaxID=7936 RepID=A0A0E9XX86_ANGAN